jgi:hypothetical protein
MGIECSNPQNDASWEPGKDVGNITVHPGSTLFLGGLLEHIRTIYNNV